MKKILFIITKSEVGGAQKWVRDQLYISKNYFTCFLATNKSGWLSKGLESDRVFLNKKIEKKFSFKYLFELTTFVKKNNIDLIVSNSASAGVHSRLTKLLMFKKVKVIYVSHGWSAIYKKSYLKKIYIKVEWFLSLFSDLILCGSNSDFNNAVSIIGINKSKLHFISNCILPFPEYEAKYNQSKKLKIVTVARLSNPKRIDLLIEAVKHLDMELHIFGDGDQKNELILRATNNIKFHGEISDFNRYNEYDIFALISDSEGLPISAIEAMSFGMPLLLSNVGGCPELINNNGYLAENNSKDIKMKLELISKNIIPFGKQSKKFFYSNFNLEKKKQIYISLYNNLS